MLHATGSPLLPLSAHGDRQPVRKLRYVLDHLGLSFRLVKQWCSLYLLFGRNGPLSSPLAPPPPYPAAAPLDQMKLTGPLGVGGPLPGPACIPQRHGMSKAK